MFMIERPHQSRHARTHVGARWIVGAVGVSILVAGCGSEDTSTAESPAPVTSVAFGAGVDRSDDAVAYSDETMVDWVTYGDVAAVIEITADEQLGFDTPEDEEAGEGFQLRQVDAQVQKVLWTHPGAEEPPSEFQFLDGTWLVNADGGEQFLGSDTKVGATYFVMLSEFDDDGWSPAVTPVEVLGDELRPTDIAIESTGADSVYNKVAGDTVQQVVDVLESTEPDPDVEQHRDLDPVHRALAASGALEVASGSTVATEN